MTKRDRAMKIYVTGECVGMVCQKCPFSPTGKSYEDGGFCATYHIPEKMKAQAKVWLDTNPTKDEKIMKDLAVSLQETLSALARSNPPADQVMIRNAREALDRFRRRK